MPSFPSKTDAFFYDAYTRAWTGACVEEMVPIYQAEMESLLAALEKGDSYRQEFAKDYRLAQRLTQWKDGELQAVSRTPSPYGIVPAQGLVLFQRDGETVYQCSYRKLFQILRFYIDRFGERFGASSTVWQWEERLEALRKGRWKEWTEETLRMLRFWDRSPGNPDAHFEGAKRLELNPGDIASFRQLRCADTLRSLTVNGLSGVRDVEVLSEYTNLTCLYLRNMGLEDISFVSSLVQLDELGLPGNSITDLSPLASLKKLTHLYLPLNPATDFSVVEQLPMLRTLYADLDQLPDQLAWDAVPERIALRVLRVIPLEKSQYHAEVIYERKAAYLAGTASAQKQEASPQKPDPRRLEIKDRWLYSGLLQSLGYCPSVKYDLTKLKSLDCSDKVPLCDDFLFLTEQGDYSCLAAAVRLWELNLSGRVVKDFSWLKRCANLQRLNLSSTAFSDLSLLSGMKQLRSLSLADCRNLQAEDLQALEMPQLRELNLSRTALSTLTPVSGMKELRSLCLTGCRDLLPDSFSVLPSLSRLQWLDLSETAFSDLKFLSNLDSLDFLYLQGCGELDGMEETLPFLTRLSDCVLPEAGKQQYAGLLTDRLLQRLEETGFRIKWGGTGRLPKQLERCEKYVPLPYREFLRRVASCISADGSVWFLTEEDYGLHPDLAFPWERWDEILPDEEEWPALLPCFVSLEKGEPVYGGISIFGKEVFCWKPGNMTLLSSSLPRFFMDWPEK